ncbi:MAG TPA: type 1 glutamine amidotransferase domain-containing protein [Bdellovibrionota bacterium]|nr:type 1 glutamine amidotransferase domain-containing protein [Bdellovibrionota bacterium]
MARSKLPILMAVPDSDFDPTESAVPWRILKNAGFEIVFATPEGGRAAADPIMVSGKGLGLLKGSMRAGAPGREAYAEMESSSAFGKPVRYADLRVESYSALMLPGGHAKGMRQYLESETLQKFVGDFFASGKPVGAVCHGVVLAARSKNPKTGKSVLDGKRTTALPLWMEMLAWNLTRTWMGDYYRTYLDKTVEGEVREALGSGAFERGPLGLGRDSEENQKAGFTVRDENYLSARWPGDAHRFGHEFVEMLNG